MATVNFSAVVSTAEDVNKPLPDGQYDVVITKAEAKTTKAGDPRIALTLKVLHGEKANKVGWDAVMFMDPNKPNAGFVNGLNLDKMKGYGVDEAQASACLDAAGETDYHAFAALFVGKQATVIIKENKDGYANVVKNKPLEGTPAGVGAPAGVPAAAPVAAQAPAPVAQAPAPVAPAPVAPAPVAPAPVAPAPVNVEI